jgi:hypothetical protein
MDKVVFFRGAQHQAEHRLKQLINWVEMIDYVACGQTLIYPGSGMS